MQIKPNRNVDSKIITSILKGFLARAWYIHYEIFFLMTMVLRKSEFEFLVHVFKENGHVGNDSRWLWRNTDHPKLWLTKQTNATTTRGPQCEYHGILDLRRYWKKFAKEKVSTLHQTWKLCNAKISVLKKGGLSTFNEKWTRI